MRPRSLEELVGQRHLAGPEGFLQQVAAARSLPSLILWGPPGTGKTTIARLLARELEALFFPLSAVTSGVKEMREVVDKARRLVASGRSAILFIDEIHRFHRGQQDALLPHVEEGTVILVGATTESPAHHLVTPLLSRCRILALEPLTDEELALILERAVADGERGLGAEDVVAPPEVLRAIAVESEGDARRALNTLEIAARLALAAGAPGALATISSDHVRQATQRRVLRGDRDGEEHYDLASAFIKSMRGSDPDAAIYYFMRMVEAGEDPRFLARRMIIFAAEDVGLADTRALPLALAAAEAFERVGLPEGTLPLAEAVLFLAAAPKSDAVIRARNAAGALVKESGSLPIPERLRDAHGALARSLGRGAGYVSPHERGPDAPREEHLPEVLRGTRLFAPRGAGDERALIERLEGRERGDEG